jgi:hypothetical protein
MKMSVSQRKTRTKPNLSPNMAAATEFIPKKDEARVGGDQGGVHNMGLRPDMIQRLLRPKTGDATSCRACTG